MKLVQTFLIMAFCLLGAAHASEALGLATIVDGQAVLVRNTVKQALKPGMRVQAMDLIESGPKSAIVRLEFNQGAVVDLGPDTRIMVSPAFAAAAKGRQGGVYALGGWVKVSGTPTKGSTAAQLLSETIDVAGVTASAVIFVSSKDNAVFAESGTAVITERRQGAAAAPVTLKAGAIFSKSASAKAVVADRPAPTFIQGVPKSFLDPVPLRASQFKTGPETVGKVVGNLTYDEAQPWLSGEPAMRALLLAQWKGHLNPDLQAGLSTKVKAHPEWDRVLFPEKYLPPKDPSAPGAKRP